MRDCDTVTEVGTLFSSAENWPQLHNSKNHLYLWLSGKIGLYDKKIGNQYFGNLNTQKFKFSLKAYIK